jgi:hypothetical protein
VLVREAEWKAKEQSNDDQWVTARESDDDTGGWNIPKDDPRRKEWIESDSKVVVSYPAINRGWPSVEGGLKVSIEVHSDLKDSEEECATCRSLIPIGCLSVLDLLSFLCYSTVGTSGRSCVSPHPCRSADQIIVTKQHVTGGHQ